MAESKILRIGVSGDRGSFSEEAALLYARQKRIKPKLAYLIDMERVLTALGKKRVDLGIFPVVNSRGGLVESAFIAMGRHNFKPVDKLVMQVRQNLMARKGISKSEIKTIVSHSQALAQCQNYLRKNFSKIKLVEWEDTAKAAKDLALGKLTLSAAVIAPAISAKLYGLRIIAKNIQDAHPNLTTFIVVIK